MLRQTLASISLIFFAFTLNGFAAPVTMTVELNNRYAASGKNQTIYALVSFSVADAVLNPHIDRTPLDLSLVIDRSGSMNERNKLIYAKDASKRLVNLLTARDAVSIVQYDDTVSTVWPHSKVNNPLMIKRIIDNLYPGGSTNLAGGMQQGIIEVGKSDSIHSTKRVILMSDGLVNNGITDPGTIARIAADARRRGISITTMGLGLNYDENLMQAIAEAGGGKYYYIENPSQMTAIYQEEMNILFNMMTSNIEYSFTHGPNIAGVTVHGYPYESDHNKTVIKMNDFHASEKRSVLLEIKLKSSKSRKIDLGSIHLQYNDTTSKKQISKAVPLSIKITKNEKLLRKNENKTVSSEAAIITADKKHEEAVKLYESGDIKAAKEKIKTLQTSLANQNSTLNSTRINKKMEALSLEESEMDKAAASPAMKQNYLKQRKHDMYMAKKGKRSSYLLEPGVSNNRVKELRQKLKDQKVYTGAIDGTYSKSVEKSVKKLQKQNNLTSDGIAGPKTLKLLDMY